MGGDRLVQKVEGFNDELAEVEKARKELKEARLKPGTARTYDTKIKLVDDWVELSSRNCGRKLQLNADIFAVLLNQMKEISKDPNLADSLKSAVLDEQLVMKKYLNEKGEAWMQSKEIQRMCDGYRAYVQKKTQTDAVRGAFTNDMVEKAVRKLKKKKEARWAEMMQIVFGAQLRKHETLGLRLSDWCKKDRRLFIRNNKAASALNLRTADEWYHKTVRYLPAVKALDERTDEMKSEGADPNDPIFPKEGYQYDEFTDMVKKMAVELKAPKELTWDGAHTLRHGGYVWLAQNYPELLKAELGLSAKQFKHYSRTNEDRCRQMMSGTKNSKRDREE